MNAGSIRHQLISETTQHHSLKLKSVLPFPNEFLQFSTLSPKPALSPFVRLGSCIKCNTETGWIKYNWCLKTTSSLFLCTCPAELRESLRKWKSRATAASSLAWGCPGQFCFPRPSLLVQKPEGLVIGVSPHMETQTEDAFSTAANMCK